MNSSKTRFEQKKLKSKFQTRFSRSFRELFRCFFFCFEGERLKFLFMVSYMVMNTTETTDFLNATDLNAYSSIMITGLLCYNNDSV